ncbi:MAG: 1-deoxy-D-xylulose-5-phosphate reductoisomerase [Flavobacteriales bacterium]|nr:1-deoxy-D-xylulose-5-phosphate reductoisomerase [Flavobacteriales bacterium]|tara:strand:+ start:42714 stop:43880 length:1167 start_codon:yes stop_codon:yes gene_type:complete
MSNNKKNIAILGSTGSIGTQTLSIINEKEDLFNAFLLSANKNYKLLLAQLKKFEPKYVVINSLEGYNYLKKNGSKYKTIILKGVEELCDLVKENDVDLVVSAIVGSAGLLPTIAAIKAKKNIALANKETLVVAGQLIMQLAKKNNVDILPVDSEHSALFQCLVGEKKSSINKLILTASGGPFLNLSKKEFKNITLSQALRHPNWVMGKKITIDSATLMNKGFELIEAFWLFDIPENKIDILIHPESIIHSLVEFIDGSTKAQLGVPEMTTPILYALSYPNRINYPFQPLSLIECQGLNFYKPDKIKFPHLDLAYQCLISGGTSSCSLNAANEVAVDAFLNKKISFVNMFKVVEKSVEKSIFVTNPNLDDYLYVDKKTRELTRELISKK